MSKTYQFLESAPHYAHNFTGGVHLIHVDVAGLNTVLNTLQSGEVATCQYINSHFHQQLSLEGQCVDIRQHLLQGNVLGPLARVAAEVLVVDPVPCCKRHCPHEKFALSFG